MSRTTQKNKSELFIDALNFESFLLKENEIDVIKSYLNTVETFFKSQIDEIHTKIEEWQKSEKENEYPAIDFYFMEYSDFNANFKKLKLESTFISSYSMFEGYLKKMAEIVKNYYDLKISINDLSGNNYILKSKNYFEKVIKLDLTNLNDTWNKISYYQKVRNKIAHNNSHFENINLKMEEDLSKLNGIKIDSGYIRLTDKQFIFDFLDLVVKYTDGIISLLKIHLKTE